MNRHTPHAPTPPARAEWVIQNRAPCILCGHGLVACSKPSDYSRIYWRHDLQDRVLVGGGTSWEIAEDQWGPKAAAYRLSMAEVTE